MGRNILVVEDDKNISDLIYMYLVKEGFDVRIAGDGGKALEEFRKKEPDLILLDIMLPVMDGWAVCAKIRETSKVPIIMLTAKSEVFDRIQGLEMGADDYIVKPFEMKELIARINAVLRRTEIPNDTSKKLHFDKLTIDLDSYELIVDGKKIDTPPKELELLYHLASTPNRVYTRNQLLDEVWGFDYFGDSRTVDVHIKRLREKVEGVSDQWALKTVWGGEKGMKRLREQFRGLYWRQMSITVGMVLLTLVLLGTVFFSLSYNYARGQKTDELLERAQVVSRLSVRYLESGRYLTMEELRQDQVFQQLAATAAMISDMDILVCDEEGHVLLSTDETMEGQSITIPEGVMSAVLEQGTWAGRSRLDQLYESKRFVGGVSVVSPTTGKVLGSVFTVSSGDTVDALWRTFAGLLVMTALVVLMISFVATSVTTMRQIKPIREMAQATRCYAEGDFDIRMNDYGRDDEIGELAASFNNMAERLQQTERQRREFIANISHELKTPMTTIAGYTDGILDGTIPPENEKQYLQIIANESRRLSRLVRRMLDVSQLQAMDPLRNGNHFDICESMRRVLISMEKKINDRHLDVEADIPDEPILVLGDNDMITQVLYNLLENAAKFAREGSTLYLGVAMMDGKARVTVRNVGDTIPAEELPLLFERFHKSDKSRSEDKDGYGLGLYIVKTILQQHKEDISVTSENGVTTFTFSLRVE